MKKVYFLTLGLVTAAMLHAQTSQTINYSGAITTFTVPVCVTSLTIEARGAQGGYNTSSSVQSGSGAVMIGTFAVTPGQTLKVLVGEQPSASGGNGGGGGTFVTDSANNPLIIAGGGGGSAGSTDSPDKHGQAGTSGGTGAAGGGTGGTAGAGGGIGSSGFQSGAGGGLLTNGADGWTTQTGGLAFVNGGSGGTANALARGGFGGGGSGSSYVVGGGGGGYSGGGSGGNSSAGVGGGGGSYNGGSNQSNTSGANLGHGVVIFTYQAAPSAPASITGFSFLCEGETTTLTAATVPGAISYTWTVPGTATILSGQGTNVISMNVGNTSGTVSVTATTGCGTSNATTLSYTVSPAPVISASASSDTVCFGTGTTLSVSGAATYSWSSGGTGSSEVVTPLTSGVYTVVGTDVGGCMDTATVAVTVNQLPVVLLGTDTIACSSVVLDAQNSGSSYLWSDNSTTQTISVSISGQYLVAVTDSNGCVGNDTIGVTISTLSATASAAMTTVCMDDASVALTGSPVGGSWSGAGVNGNSFAPDSAGMGTHTLVYLVTDSLGCTDSASVVIDVQLCTGIDIAAATGYSVYPNPNNGTFTLILGKEVEVLVIEVTDLQGRMIFTSNAKQLNAGFTQQISLDNQASGIYMMRVVADGVQSVQKVSVQK